MLVDKFGRIIYYLRVSVTDKCNFKCIYCNYPQSNESLSVELQDFIRVIRIFVKLGIKKVRISGGEPLLHDGIIDFISELKKLNLDIGITTNASLLNEDILSKIIKLGIKRLNISLDTTDSEKFEFITKTKAFYDVTKNIKNISLAGLSIKFNCVVLKNINSTLLDIIQLIDFAYQHNAIIRFIEYMPVGRNNSELFYPVIEIINQLKTRYNLKKITSVEGFGPGDYYIYNKKIVGFITPMSTPFCNSCNRLRLTSKLTIRSCLGYNYETDLKNCLTEEEIKNKIYDAVNNKPPIYSFDTTVKDCMRSIGG
ncbi:MAG: radical SAM protein [Endomicrobia bacterium]|nr:radical SAM protein [Endomicrobiia bacterium]